jgi:hypothetical protein
MPESRFTMNGVKLEFAAGKAAQSPRMATGWLFVRGGRPTTKGDEDRRADTGQDGPIPSIKLIDSNEPVLFGLEDGTLFFSFGKRTLTTANAGRPVPTIAARIFS